MLNQPAPFPYPGSAALLGGKRVRIMSIVGDGRRFVSGDGVLRTVPVDQLSDAALPDDPLAAWFAERVVRSDGDAPALTAVIDLLDDCRAFLNARGAAVDQLPYVAPFGRFLEAQDLRIVRRRLPGSHWAQRCVPVTLKPEVEA